MKFSHTLSLNSNPDWAEHYIDYAGLKKVINEAQAYRGDSDDPEQIQDDRREIFLSKLTPMVANVRHFYDQKKAALDVEMARLRPLLEKSSSRLSLASLPTKNGWIFPVVCLAPVRVVNKKAVFSKPRFRLLEVILVVYKLFPV